MSDYPMLISNKLHSFRNFMKQIYIIAQKMKQIYIIAQKIVRFFMKYALKLVR